MKNVLITRHNNIAVPGEHIVERQSLAFNPVSQPPQLLNVTGSSFDTCESILLGGFGNS